jgi:hypothetical protein
MSYSIQSRQPWSPQIHEDEPVENILRFEIGWKDVASGLGKILFGYFMLVLTLGIVVGLVLYLAATAMARRPNAQDIILAMWVCYLGFGIVFLLGLYTYIQIIVGHVRCAIHSPERCGARWFIFACILCVVVGPWMGTINSVQMQMSTDTAEKKQKLRQELIQHFHGQTAEDGVLAEIRRGLSITQIASALISMASSLFFVLFLRSIGSCFQETRLTVLADLYLVFSAMLMSMTFYTTFFTRFNQSTVWVFAAIGVGGLVSAGWYIGLLIYCRVLILTRMNNLRSPLEG